MTAIINRFKNAGLKLNILLLDDDPDYLTELKERIIDDWKQKGFATTKKQEAIIEFTNRLNTQEQFDVAIIDIFLDSHPEGIKVGEDLKKIDPSIFLIALSTDTSIEMIEEISKNHFNAMVGKRFNSNLLGRLLLKSLYTKSRLLSGPKSIMMGRNYYKP